MRAIRGTASALLREAALGAWLGLWFLGIGSRIAMRANGVALGQPPMLNTGGTITVIACGAAAGVAGALFYALSRVVAARLAGGTWAANAQGTWVRPLRLTLFAALLAFVTARGLAGSPGPTWYFWLLVAAYGASLEFALVRRARNSARPPSHGAVASELTPVTPAR